MTINWNNYVDQIYSITYVHNKKRKSELNKELERVDILNSSIYMNIEQFPSVFDDVLLEKFKDNTFGIGKKKSYFNQFLGYYRAIKHAYEAGYENILIIEDDVRFLKDKNRIIQEMSYLDEYYKHSDKPCIFCGSVSYYKNGEDAGLTYDEPYIETTSSSLLFCSSSFNIYNRKAIEYLLNYMESYKFSLLDQYNIIYDNSVLFIILNKHICLQQDWIFLMLNTTKEYNMVKPTPAEIIMHRQSQKYFNKDYNAIYNNLLNSFDYSQEEKENILKIPIY